MIKELKISSDIKLSAYIKEEGKPDLDLEYVSKSPDPWYRDQDEQVSISAEKAKEIVKFLIEIFPGIAK
jgi:hypothetical protein